MPPTPAPLSLLVETCERLYARDGFVKWSDVGTALGVSRQAVQLRLRAAVDRGALPPEDVARWQSMTSRVAASRERRKASRAASHEQEKLRITVTLTPENLDWLRRESVFRKATSADIINGLLNRERQLPQ